MRLSILIQVTHLLGSGHLTRAAALAEACASRGHRVVLVSGGMPNALAYRQNYELMQLPPVKIEGTAFTRLLSPQGEPVDADYHSARQKVIAEQITALKPDVLITELFPFGRRVLAAEFLSAIDAVRAQPKPVSVLASIRDILNPPSRPERENEAVSRLTALYDGVLVHGDPALVPLEASWPVSGSLAPYLHYTGYIDNPAPPATVIAAKNAEIIVSGGFSAASLPLYQAANAAALKVGRTWRILVGHGVSEDDFKSLASDASPNVIIERARPDFRALLAQASLSISQCGYNTAIDVLGAPLRRLFVPFEDGGETEQLLRSETLAKRELAAVLREQDLTPDALANAVTMLLEAPPPALPSLHFDGAAVSAELIEALHLKVRQ